MTNCEYLVRPPFPQKMALQCSYLDKMMSTNILGSLEWDYYRMQQNSSTVPP